MNLDLFSAAGRNYKSGSQIARVVTEEWGSRNLYCPACPSDTLTQAPPNTRVFDFECPGCGQFYQLKGRKDWNENKVLDAGYAAMIDAIRKDRVPNLFVLQYSLSWRVQNILLIPYFFIGESVVEKRKPLSVSARRAGWTGCNIILREIPEDGKLRVVINGVVTDTREVRRRFQRIKPFADMSVKLRGWTLDVFRVVTKLNKPQFSISEVYKYEDELAALHPGNRNIRPKIRQKLQVLRDLGFLRFAEPGRYILKNKE